MRIWVAVGVMGLLMAGCGTTYQASQPISPSPSPSSSPSPSPSSSPTVPGFPAVIVAAMNYLSGRTTVPLQAPTILPDQPSTPPYVSAVVRAQSDSYVVDLQLTTTALPVNSPLITSGVNSAISSFYASFGGQRFTSPSAARAAVQGITCAPCASLTTGPTGSVVLGSGVTALAYGTAGGSPALLRWVESGWSYEVYGDPTMTVQIAKQLVSYIQTQPLPASQGGLSVDAAADGLHTLMAWSKANLVYTAGAYHQYQIAVPLADGMRQYP